MIKEAIIFYFGKITLHHQGIAFIYQENNQITWTKQKKNVLGNHNFICKKL